MNCCYHPSPPDSTKRRETVLVICGPWNMRLMNWLWKALGPCVKLMAKDNCFKCNIDHSHRFRGNERRRKLSITMVSALMHTRRRAEEQGNGRWRYEILGLTLCPVVRCVCVCNLRSA